MALVKAPFTIEQISKLKEWQSGEGHPFTCCSSGSLNNCQRRNKSGEGILIPSETGWICPCGEYRQDWCHEFMVK